MRAFSLRLSRPLRASYRLNISPIILPSSFNIRKFKKESNLSPRASPSDRITLTQHTTWALGVTRRTYLLSGEGKSEVLEGSQLDGVLEDQEEGGGGTESPRGAVRAFLPWLSKSIKMSKYERRLDAILVHLLPKDFRQFPQNYFAYARWYMMASVAGSASMVLSTQSMLYAIGLGAGAIPMAAALNWVIKDGLGQLGGVLFASCVNSRFDADPKRWRMVAAVSLDAACFLEALTPLAPIFFLPMASIANMGKNVSWLAASATRANIHLSFARRANLADITAKAGSQTVLASTIGTTLGVFISPLVGTHPTTILPAIAAISSFHLFCTFQALSKVKCDTLNAQRAEIATIEFLNRFNSNSPRPTGDDKVGWVPSPSWVSEREIVIGKPIGSNLMYGYSSSLPRKVVIGVSLDSIAKDSLLDVWGSLRDRGVHVSSTNQTVNVLIAQNATAPQILEGFLEAMGASMGVHVPKLAKDAYLDGLKAAGWNTKVLFLETYSARVSVSTT
ncbi:hypothetical protein AAMO2058_000785800 [Amorphochlora amoebiformis]